MFPSFNARALGLDLSAEATIDLAAAAGFRGVDLLVRDLVDTGRDPAALRRRMEDRGLIGGAWPLPVRWRGDAATFRHDSERLPRYAEAAAVLGLRRTGTWVLPAAEGPLAQIEALHEERLSTIARILADHGTRLGLEVIGVASSWSGQGTPFLHRMGDPAFAHLLCKIRAVVPDVGVLVDAFHLYAAGEGIETGLAWGVESIVWVHVADLPAGSDGNRAAIRDEDRGLPGEHGAVACHPLLASLSRLGYDGPVTAEPQPGCRSLAGLGPEAAARKVARALAAIWPEAAPQPGTGDRCSSSQGINACSPTPTDLAAWPGKISSR
ncbi:MAG: sugar phosphate isomerase/epimerase [Isosphaeraceae bacterium]|nr:sugar phosphate isomerase/epimerase [Isosphaeraceae bacterium]